MLYENAFKEMPTLANRWSNFRFSSGIQVYFWTQRPGGVDITSIERRPDHTDEMVTRCFARTANRAESPYPARMNHIGQSVRRMRSGRPTSAFE